jgi:hypothetical protein
MQDPAYELPRISILSTWVNNLAIKSASYGGCNGSADIVQMGYSIPVILASDAEDTKMAGTVREGIIGYYPGPQGA